MHDHVMGNLELGFHAPMSVSNCNVLLCVVHGGWSDWTEWGQCSETCGEGLAERSRTCDSPLAQHGGRKCTGKDSDRQSCNLKPCARKFIDFSCICTVYMNE